MSKKLNFNPNNPVEVLEFLDSLSSDKSVILENMTIIAASETNSKKSLLESYFRVGNFTIDELSEASYKIDKLLTIAVEQNIPVSESVQTHLMALNAIVKRRIEEWGDPVVQSDKLWLDINDDLIEDEPDDDFSSWWSNNKLDAIWNQSPTPTLERIENADTFTIKMLESMVTLCVEGIIPEDHHNELFEKVANRCITAAEYQCNHELNKTCLPITAGICKLKDVLSSTYTDFPDKLQKINSIFDNILSGVGDVHEQFMSKLNKNIVSESETVTNSVDSGNSTIDDNYINNPFTLNGLTPYGGVKMITNLLCRTAGAENDEELAEIMTEFLRLENVINNPDYVKEYASVTESNKVAEKAREVARKSNKFVNSTLKGAQKKGEETKVAIGKITEPMTKFVEDSMQKIKKADKDQRREIIIKNSMFPKVKRFIKQALVGGAIGIVNPVTGAIAFLGMLATNTMLDGKERRQIIREMESELVLVNEKIEDSRGDEDKQKKYELMRIKNKLENELQRAKFHLKE